MTTTQTHRERQYAELKTKLADAHPAGLTLNELVLPNRPLVVAGLMYALTELVAVGKVHRYRVELRDSRIPTFKYSLIGGMD